MSYYSYSVFDKDAPKWLRRIVVDIRKESLAEGVDPVDFPEYLKARGVQMKGVFFELSDEIVTYAELKYG